MRCNNLNYQITDESNSTSIIINPTDYTPGDILDITLIRYYDNITCRVENIVLSTESYKINFIDGSYIVSYNIITMNPMYINPKDDKVFYMIKDIKIVK